MNIENANKSGIYVLLCFSDVNKNIARKYVINVNTVIVTIYPDVPSGNNPYDKNASTTIPTLEAISMNLFLTGSCV